MLDAPPKTATMPKAMAIALQLARKTRVRQRWEPSFTIAQLPRHHVLQASRVEAALYVAEPNPSLVERDTSLVDAGRKLIETALDLGDPAMSPKRQGEKRTSRNYAILCTRATQLHASHAAGLRTCAQERARARPAHQRPPQAARTPHQGRCSGPTPPTLLRHPASPSHPGYRRNRATRPMFRRCLWGQTLRQAHPGAGALASEGAIGVE